MIVEQHNTAEIVKGRCEERKTTTIEYPLKPHDQFQFIKLFVSNKGEKNLSNYTEKDTAEINNMDDVYEKSSSAVVQDMSPMHSVKAKHDSPLRKKTVSFAQNVQLAGSHSPEKCRSLQRKYLASLSEEKVLSAWDKLRMEMPADQDNIKSPQNLNESTTGSKDAVIQNIPDVFDREKPGNTSYNSYSPNWD